MVNSIFRCENINKNFGNSEVLKGIDITLYEGETIALMGESGCGKSTLLKTLNFIEFPNNGDSFLKDQQYMKYGEPLFELHEIRREIGLVFQEYHLFPNLKCMDNITLPLMRVKNFTSDAARKISENIASELGIFEILQKYPDEISGGQAQRLSIARAIVLNPTILLLDEITSALDPSSTLNVISAIKKLRDIKDLEGLGIIMVTHHLQFAKEFATRILFMDQGKIIENHLAQDFENNCQSKIAKSFISKSKFLS